MNSGIIIGMSIALFLSVWVWIAIIIMNRVSLERKLEKLNSITNRLPEEEKQLRQLKDLRTIEQGKVSSAKWIVGLFMLLLVVSMIAAPSWEPLQELFGFEILRHYEVLATGILAFFCLPTFVGLTLAGSTAREKDLDAAPKETIEKASA